MTKNPLKLRSLAVLLTVSFAAILYMPAGGAFAANKALTSNNTPFPSSNFIVGARWTSKRIDGPPNMSGDILPTTWADNDYLYTSLNDGAIAPNARESLKKYSGKNLVGKISGRPPRIKIKLVGRPEQLGPYYSLGLTSVNRVLYATQTTDWEYTEFQPYDGLEGIAYSSDHGAHWTFPYKRFPALAGDLNWVMEGKDKPNPDGYMYAIANDREFNSSKIVLGRSLPGPENVTDPDRWQWFSGMSGGQPQWSADINAAQPTVEWFHHISYPQMTYAPGLRRYLLSFTWDYVDDKEPVTDGMELVVLESETPWGPFSFVFREQYFGPSNGYGASFPIKWQSSDGRNMWMKWAANYGGCTKGLDCSASGAINLRKIHFKLAGD